MQLLLPASVFLLMVSVGMSLKLTEVVAHWRRMNRSAWIALLTATFIVPPALALICANLFHLTRPETVGVFLVGVAPGAPLLTRNLAQRGFDMQMAASYQVWAALMVPIMIPLLVWSAARLYGRTVWIPPHILLWQIIVKQFLPLAVGILIAWLLPKFAQRSQRAMNIAGNVLLTLLIVIVLFKLGPALRQITPLVPVAALIVAIGSIAVFFLFRFSSPQIRETFAICNANRHVGLALLLSGQYFHAQRAALPVIACYAVLAPLTMFAYVRLGPARKKVAATESAKP